MAPRKEKNGFVLIFWHRHVLIQVRGDHMEKMPGYFGAPGGMYNEQDVDSLDTAVREVFEETGYHLPKKHLVKFAEGNHVDWYAIDLTQSLKPIKRDRDIKDRWELGDARRYDYAQAFYGHLWVDADKELENLRKSNVYFKGPGTGMMGGLENRIQQALEALEMITDMENSWEKV